MKRKLRIEPDLPADDTPEPVTAIREQLEAARLDESEARERVAALEQQLQARADQEADELRLRISLLEPALSRAERAARQAREELEAARAQHVERLRVEEERIGHLDRELAARLDREVELRQEVSSLEKRVTSLRSSFEDATRRASALEDELAHSAGEASELRDGLAAATQRADKLETELAKEARQAKRLEAERLAAVERADALQAALDQVRAAVGDIAAAAEPAAPEPEPVAAAEPARPEPVRPPDVVGPVIVEVGPGDEDAFHRAPSPRARIRPDGRFLQVNAAFSDLLGYEEAELAKAVWPPAGDRKKLPKLRETTRRVLNGESRIARVETQYPTAHGRPAKIVGTLSLVTNDDGEPYYLELALDQ